MIGALDAELSLGVAPTSAAFGVAVACCVEGVVFATAAGTRALAPSPGLPHADARTTRARSADCARDIMEPEKGRAVPRSSERIMLMQGSAK